MAVHTGINSVDAAKELAVSLGATHAYTEYMHEVDPITEVRLAAYPWSTCFMRKSEESDGYIEVGYYTYAMDTFSEITRPIPLSYFDQFDNQDVRCNHLTCSDITEVA